MDNNSQLKQGIVGVSVFLIMMAILASAIWFLTNHTNDASEQEYTDTNTQAISGIIHTDLEGVTQLRNVLQKQLQNNQTEQAR